MGTFKTISALPSHPDSVILPSDFNRIHEAFEEFVELYGKLFTVQFANRPMVVVADAKLINFVLRKRPDLFGSYHRKNRVLEAMKVDGIEAADGHDWKRQREIIAESMQSSYLVRYFENIKSVTEDLKNRWITSEKNFSKTNLEAEIFGFSISVFTAIVFGDITYMPTDEQESTRNLLQNLVVILSRRIDALLSQVHLENFSEDRDFEEEILKVFSVIENIVAHNRSLLPDYIGTGKADSMLQALMMAMEKKGLDNGNLKLIENLLLVVLAAEPTTANTLFRVLGRIAANAQVQKEIQDEVDTILGDGGIIDDIEDIKKLKCIDAVIFETMRMSSVSRLAIVEAKADLLLEDVEIPSGTPLVLLIAYCGLDKENFHRAAVFDHQRWRSESRTKSAQYNNKACLGFGAGPRSCPGRGLAMLVIKTAVAMICGNFQIRPSSEKSVSKGKLLPLDFTVEIRSKSHDITA